MAAATTAAASTIPAMLGTLAAGLGLPLGVVWGGFGLATALGFVHYPSTFEAIVGVLTFGFNLFVVFCIVYGAVAFVAFCWHGGVCAGWISAHAHHDGEHHEGEHHEEHGHDPHPTAPGEVWKFGTNESRAAKATPGTGGGKKKGKKK